MEELMQYVWHHRLWNPAGLRTNDGRPVQVIDPGQLNRDAGPDFFNAKVRIGSEMWSGNVEIHVRASDWHRHGHQSDPAYDSVILHVVEKDDCAICRRDGHEIPQVEMPCARDFSQRFAAFIHNPANELKCAAELESIENIHLRSWLDSLAMERLNDKVERINGWLDSHCSGDWQTVAYLALARALGAGKNSEAFERLALATPLRIMQKHSDSQLSVEALLFGQAGLLDSAPSDPYTDELKMEYAFLTAKFRLQRPASPLGWKMSRMRPAAFPHRRIAALASMVCNNFHLMDKILDVKTEDDARRLFDVRLTGYWTYHFSFRPSGCAEESPAEVHAVSRSTTDMLIINVVAPLLAAYGRYIDSPELADRAIDILEHLPAEKNAIVSLFERAGVKCPDAFTSQALIQLKRNYCEPHKCLYCRIGHRLLAARTMP